MNNVILFELLIVSLSKNTLATACGQTGVEQQNEDWKWTFRDNKNLYTNGFRHTQDTSNTSARAIEDISTTPSVEDDPCADYDPPVPDFSAPGRRISEMKCFEYIWALRQRDVKKTRQAECKTRWNHYRNRGFGIGGRYTSKGEFPNMGAVGWKASQGTWVFKCGSTLISPKFMLTAGHCTKASPRDTTIADPVPKIIRLGDKNIADKFGYGRRADDVNISRIIVHPQYAPPKKYYDIALMELEKTLEFSKVKQPACLWTNFDTSTLGAEATFTGWGVIETATLKTSPELQAGVVDILDTQLCEKLLRPNFNRHWYGFQDHQLCAGKLTGGVDTCQGDSGGPLQVKINLPVSTEGNMHYIVGITSFGIGCARTNSPSVYTRVSSFVDWIEDIVWR